MGQPSNPFNDFVFLNATPSDRGSFTLATDKALEKLEKFQLPDPTFFILQWIQALVASGGERIEVTCSSSNMQTRFEMEIVFDGPGYSRTEIDSLYDHVFRSGRDRSVDRLRELALGWLSACSLPLTEMTLDSNGRRRIREGRAEKTVPSPGWEEGTGGTTEQHCLRLSGRGSYPFEDILRRRCQEAPCSLYLNGDLISSSSGAGVPWPNRPFKSGPTQGLMGATYGGSAASHIAFLRYGVEFVSRPEESLQPPVILRVSDDTLSKNVSQTDVVRDEAYEEFLARVRTEMKNMGLQLTSKRIPSYQREALNSFIQSYLVSYIDVRVFDDPQRLKLMGEEFKNLINFPLFRAAGGNYRSLADLRKEYQQKGYLLYAIDRRTQTARWDGLLLVLEPEEVNVLKKFFANVTALTYEEVRDLCRGFLQRKLSDAARLRPICSVRHRLNPTDPPASELELVLPDTYPTGLTTIVTGGRKYGATLPGVQLTLLVKTPRAEFSSGDMARLRHSLEKPVRELLTSLSIKLSSPEISRNQSRMRYAELACEQLIYLLDHGTGPNVGGEIMAELPVEVLSAPIIGLEDGSLVSLLDLKTFLEVVGKVYWGGAFVEGLESGALDPMPAAELLLSRVLLDHQFVLTDRVRDRLDSDPDLKFHLRRQTLMKGLAANPDPVQTLKNFANEAAAEAELLARMERDYKEALQGPKLFIKPDEARLEELAESVDGDDFVPFELGTPDPDSASPETTPTVRLAPPSAPAPPPPLPTIEHDLDGLRALLGDFCSAPNTVHTERREELFSLHLCTVWGAPREGSVQLLQENQATPLSHPLPLEGFIRISPEFDGEPSDLLEDAAEQLVMKALHLYKAEPDLPRQRTRLREWLLRCCEFLPRWQRDNRAIANDLLHLPLVPCLGDRLLSWQQLKWQARRRGHTLVADPESRSGTPDRLRDVIDLDAPWRDDILEQLEFPTVEIWRERELELNFDTLLRNAWKEMTTVISGQDEDLIRPEVIGKLAGGSSFWTRWRLGFLSWDPETDRALVNPEHKLGKKLLDRYRHDPTMAAVLASALFSTINRGLEEVQDHHEKAFLEGLLDTLA